MAEIARSCLRFVDPYELTMRRQWCERCAGNLANGNTEILKPLWHAEYGDLIMVESHWVLFPRILPRLKLSHDSESRVLEEPVEGRGGQITAPSSRKSAISTMVHHADRTRTHDTLEFIHIADSFTDVYVHKNIERPDRVDRCVRNARQILAVSNQKRRSRLIAVLLPANPNTGLGEVHRGECTCHFHQYSCPASCAWANFQDVPSWPDILAEYIGDQRHFPLGTRGPLFASAVPVPIFPNFLVGLQTGSPRQLPLQFDPLQLGERSFRDTA